MSTQDALVPMAGFKAFFEKAPVIAYVVDTKMRLVAASDALLNEVGFSRESIVGKDVFDVFPANPEDVGGNGVDVLRASLDRAFATGVSETLPRQRYDVRSDPGAPFEERYWLPQNVPVMNNAGEVAYVIHSVVASK